MSSAPGADLPDRIADAAEVCRTATMEGVVDEWPNLNPVELIPAHNYHMHT